MRFHCGTINNLWHKRPSPPLGRSPLRSRTCHALSRLFGSPGPCIGWPCCLFPVLCEPGRRPHLSHRGTGSPGRFRCAEPPPCRQAVPARLSRARGEPAQARPELADPDVLDSPLSLAASRLADAPSTDGETL